MKEYIKFGIGFAIGVTLVHAFKKMANDIFCTKETETKEN